MEIASCTAKPNSCQEQGVNSSFAASETRVAAISASQSLDMALVTAEGDKVTLSYDAYAAAIYAEHGQVEATQDGLAIQWTEFSAGKYERELELSIEGDLNAQERREIRKAIKTLGRMLDKFVEGKAPPMMSAARHLGGLETIAQLDVSMAYEQQVLTARQNDMVLTYGQHGEGVHQPAQPVQDTIQAPLQSEEKPLANETVQVALHAETKKLAKEMAKVVRAVEAPWKDVLRMAKGLFDHLSKKAESKDSLVAELINDVQEKFKALVASEEDD